MKRPGFIKRLFRRSAGIEAGGGGRRWQGAPVLTAPQQSALAARGPAKARAAGQYINTPYGNRIVEAWVAALAGKGWQTRSGHADADTRHRLNEAFEALVAPHLVAICRALVRDGESFIHLIPTEDGSLRLRHLPADQIDPALHRDLGNGGRIIAGVELDAQEEVVAFHVLPEAPGAPFAAFGEAIRVPAGDMLHVCDQLFPGQVRGLTWLSSVLTKLRDRDEAGDALLMQLKVAALVTGFISDPEGGAAGFEAPPGSPDLTLEPGAMRILPPGSDVRFSTPGQGLTQAVDFLRAQDREIAAGVGMTFESLTGDLGEANYSSARVGLLDFRRRAEMLQKLLIEGQFLRPLWKSWIEVQVLSGMIPADQMADHLPVRFVPPGWQWVDPRNEVEATVAAIAAGLTSRAEAVAQRGRDIDELDEEIARDAARAAARQDKDSAS